MNSLEDVDLRELYKVGPLTYSLKTKCPKTAEKQVRDALHKLEVYWNKVRMDKELPCSQFLVSATNIQSNDLSIKFTKAAHLYLCLLYTSPSPRDQVVSRMPSSA